MRLLYPGRIEILKCWGFFGARKTRELWEIPSEKGENLQQTQLTYGTWPELNLGHIRGWEASTHTTAPSCSATFNSGIWNLTLRVSKSLFMMSVTSIGVSSTHWQYSTSILTNNSTVLWVQQKVKYQKSPSLRELTSLSVSLLVQFLPQYRIVLNLNRKLPCSEFDWLPLGSEFPR